MGGEMRGSSPTGLHVSGSDREGGVTGSFPGSSLDHLCSLSLFWSERPARCSDGRSEEAAVRLHTSVAPAGTTNQEFALRSAAHFARRGKMCGYWCHSRCCANLSREAQLSIAACSSPSDPEDREDREDRDRAVRAAKDGSTSVK